MKHVGILVIVVVGTGAAFVLWLLLYVSSLPPTLLFLDSIFIGFISLILRNRSSIKTTSHMIDIREWLFLTQSFLVQQVVRRRDIVMSIRLDTLHCVVRIETKFVKDLLIDGVL